MLTGRIPRLCDPPTNWHRDTDIDILLGPVSAFKATYLPKRNIFGEEKKQSDPNGSVPAVEYV
jgi:hypothetical protein